MAIGSEWAESWCPLVSAGFCDGVSCYGRSETLGVESRGYADAVLIK